MDTFYVHYSKGQNSAVMTKNDQYKAGYDNVGSFEHPSRGEEGVNNTNAMIRQARMLVSAVEGVKNVNDVTFRLPVVDPEVAPYAESDFSVSGDVSESTQANKVPLEAISLSESSVKLRVGESYTIQVEYTPSDTSETGLVYESEDPRIASVSKSGVVKGVASGNTILAVAASSNQNLMETIEVEVEATGPNQEPKPADETTQTLGTPVSE